MAARSGVSGGRRRHWKRDGPAHLKRFCRRHVAPRRRRRSTGGPHRRRHRPELRSPSLANESSRSPHRIPQLYTISRAPGRKNRPRGSALSNGCSGGACGDPPRIVQHIRVPACFAGDSPR
jgi:hypothetical protein